MKGTSSPIPEFLESPIPILTLRRSIFKIILNDCFLLAYTVKVCFDYGNGEPLLFGFPWLLISLMFTTILFLFNNPNLKEVKYLLPGSFISLVLSMRLLLLVNQLNTAQEGLLNIEFLTIDVSGVETKET
jgi:hypothetical protein